MAKLSPKEFIQIWQSSETLEEVVERTGMFKTSVNSRAYSYRQKGVPLKKFAISRGVSEYDWKELADFADKTLAESYMEEMEEIDQGNRGFVE